MWKKILWIVAALYPLSVIFIITANAGTEASLAGLVPGFLIFLVPLALFVFELRDGESSKLWQTILLVLAYLFSFVLLGIGMAGYYSFNTPTFLNLIKGLPLLIILLALFYFAFKRMFKKKA